ncbi:DUF6415 family natural product biosynthesis protein [Streptomyces sp. 2P-4]|uniref:DUF6415 family natural product biosynthesis protein n=1 Tax=Streptomyces sp. 2P-4 TaxID=2931974 RepID=UPI0025415E63|nr:DUF6415 family natural product biosynthesis protein [Streptomyces sp. 2P-4]
MGMPQDHTGATALIARALASYAERPGPEAVAALVDDLLTCGQELHGSLSRAPSQHRPAGTVAALAEWEYFAAVGPLGSGPHANWNYARALARIIRQLLASGR